MKRTKKLFSILLTLVMLCDLLPTFAQADGEIRCYADTTWSVSNSGNTFTVTRNGDLTRTETVYYRTVSLSAVEGQHFTRATGTLTFDGNERERSKSVTVTELNPTGAYAYQVGATRNYRFEVCDPGGFTLASADRAITKGTSVSENALRWISVDVSSGSYTISDSGYAQAYIPLPIDKYFNQAPKGYLQLVGATELHMYVDMEVAESDDGYQYIQIYVNDTTNVDTGAEKGDPGTVSNSAYAAGFGHEPGKKNTSFYQYRFPVSSVGDNSGAEKPWNSQNNTVGKLYNQKFNSNRRPSSDGYLRLCANASTGIETLADLNTVGIRLNASGDFGDTWYAKNIKSTIKAFDIKIPVADTAKIVVAPVPGSGDKYRQDNLVYVTVPFSEIVVSQGQPFLVTTWGNLPYEAGLGTNTLTFKGRVPSGKTSTILKVSGISDSSVDIKDLAGNTLNKSFKWDGADHVTAADYAYTVEYDPGDGENLSGQVTSYTYSSAAFTLQETYQLGYVFTGWTGTNGSTPQTAVTVATHSRGDRHYTANWSETDTWDIANGANGSAEHPYLIRTKDELICLRDWVNRGTTFSEKYFRLCDHIDMQGIEFDSIGYTGKPFSGNFDGFENTIHNLTASRGLFGRIENGAVSNLTLDHITVSKSGAGVGGLVGYANNAMISSCIVTNATVSGNDQVGGFVGSAEYATISSCVVANTTVSGSNHVGGFVGYTTEGTVSDCVVAASTVSGSGYVGGFCGYQFSGSTDCFVLGTDVTATGTYCGAVFGRRNGIFYPYNYNCTCTINGNAQTGNNTIIAYTVYTVTAEEDITVSGTAAKTYENVNYYQKNAELSLAYTGEVSTNYGLAYAVNDTRIEGDTFNINSDSTVSVAWKKLLTHPDISVSVPAQTYTGSALMPAITVKDGETTLTEDTDYAVSIDGEHTNAGDYTGTLTGIRNYGGTATATFTINPAGVTLTANSGTETYNGAEQTVTGYTASVDGLIFDGVTASGSGTNVGEYDVTSTGVIVNTTTDSTGNYVVTETTDGKLTISQKPVTVTAKAQTVAPGGSIATGTDQATLTDAVNGHTLTAVTLTASSTETATTEGTITPSAATIKIGETDVTANYAITYEPGVLTVRAPMTYNVTFLAGEGGSGNMDPATAQDGATYTIPACTFTTPENKIFKEWSVKIGEADPVSKQPNDTIVVTDDTTVTAVWENTHTHPVFGKASFVLPSGINTIEANAFEGDTLITVVDANHCAVIGAKAFKGCTGLIQIRLPKNCSIAPDAFDSCGTIYVFAPAGGTTEAYCNNPLNHCVFVND